MDHRLFLWFFLALFVFGGFVLFAGVKSIERSIGESEFAYESGTACARILRHRRPRTASKRPPGSLPVEAEKM